MLLLADKNIMAFIASFHLGDNGKIYIPESVHVTKCKLFLFYIVLHITQEPILA